MEVLKKCFNPKILLGLALVAIGVAVFAPRALASALPLLLVAACPLSMILMMTMMGGNHDKNTSSNEIDILKERFAKGNITEQDFEGMKRTLQSH